MALSRKERNQIRRAINDYLEKLDKGSLSRKERNQIRRDINEQLARLDSAIDAKPETAPENEKLQKLIAGDYNSLEPMDFIAIIKEIADEIGTLEPVKPPVVEYVRLKNKSGAITESAQAALFNMVDGDGPENEEPEMDKAVNE